MTRTRLAAAIGALVLFAGCGDEGNIAGTTTTREPVTRLSAADRDFAFAADRAIAAYCRRVVAAGLGQAKLPAPRVQRRALERVDELAALAAVDPRAQIETGVSITLFIGDLAENLQGSNCDPRVIQRLDAALAGLPAG